MIDLFFQVDSVLEYRCRIVSRPTVSDGEFGLKLDMIENHQDGEDHRGSRARLTMEYPNVDVQGGRRLHSVRRRLFQDDEGDREGDSSRNSGVEDNLANCFFEEARKNRENAKERWNFDFEKEEPLPGRYVWVKLNEHGNEVGNPLETRNRVENLQIMQDEDAQDDDFAMQDQPEDKDDDKMTDST